MTDDRQPFDLRRNEDFIFAKEPWWMHNRVLTTSGAVLGMLLLLGGYTTLIVSMVRVAQAWAWR